MNGPIENCGWRLCIKRIINVCPFTLAHHYKGCEPLLDMNPDDSSKDEIYIPLKISKLVAWFYINPEQMNTL